MARKKENSCAHCSSLDAVGLGITGNTILSDCHVKEADSFLKDFVLFLTA
jgi:hypothetical protein